LRPRRSDSTRRCPGAGGRAHSAFGEIHHGALVTFPHFSWSVCLNPHAHDPQGGRHAKQVSAGVQEAGFLDLITARRPVAEVAADLEVTGQTFYNWRNQDLIDQGERAGVTSSDLAELVAAKRPIAELERPSSLPRRVRTSC
jgi:transposase-like protein